MPLQNRVTAFGEIVCAPERGTLMGNRGGRIHRPDRTLSERRWASKAWITCRLDFKGRRRQVMAPHSYTELFFLDEATAFAAGHRPCAECRYAEFKRFRELWSVSRRLPGRAYVRDIDALLHRERVGNGRGKGTYRCELGALPDGTMVIYDRQPHLLFAGRLNRWSLGGYLAAVRYWAQEIVTVLTPPSIVAVFLAGYCPATHPSLQNTDEFGDTR